MQLPFVLPKPTVPICAQTVSFFCRWSLEAIKDDIARAATERRHLAGETGPPPKKMKQL